jgi:hypothetical protein
MMLMLMLMLMTNAAMTMAMMHFGSSTMRPLHSIENTPNPVRAHSNAG